MNQQGIEAEAMVEESEFITVTMDSARKYMLMLTQRRENQYNLARHTGVDSLLYTGRDRQFFTDMSSKVIVSIPTDPLQQINKKHQDLVNVERSTNFGMASADPTIRVNQLEQNIRFLQEQHQIMLSGLHSEIENLRQRNRDLQFQIVFSKEGVTFVSSSSSSSDEDPQGRKIILSPQQVNTNSFQFELMERDIADLKTNLSEARTRNVYLQNIVDEQKKKLSALENEKLDLAAVGKKIGKENSGKGKLVSGKETNEELHEKLEDADRLIRRLRRENEEQRKEIVSLRMTINKSISGGNSHRGYYRNSQSQTSRFPPLHGNWKNNSPEYQVNRNQERIGNRLAKDAEIVGRPVPNLPHLRDRSNASSSTTNNNTGYNNYSGGSHKRGYYYHRKVDDRSGSRISRREQIYESNNK